MTEEKVCPVGAIGSSPAGAPVVPPLPSAPGELDALRAQLAIVSDRLAKVETALAYCVTVNAKLDAHLKRFDPVLQEGAAAVAKFTDPATGKVKASFWDSVPWPVRKILGK